ncbi:MAG: tetratricopeptide repeat protein [Deltaproteobacteria bacterium]|nr:tetratricopeptide repeat protein [Deltaproteobacteria bacterium]
MRFLNALVLAFFMVFGALLPVMAAEWVPEIYLRGLDQASQGKYSQGKKIFQEILASDPFYDRAVRCLKIIDDLESRKITDDTASHLFKGLSHYYRDRFPEALAEADLALKINPRYARAYNVRGGFYYGTAKYDQAIADFDRALEIDPAFAVSYYNRGCAFLQIRQYDRAKADFDRAVELEPKYYSAYHNRGILYFQKGQYFWALADFNRALEIHPKLPEGHLNQALTFEEVGKEQEAVAAYKKFLQYATPAHTREVEYARKRLGVLEK